MDRIRKNLSPKDRPRSVRTSVIETPEGSVIITTGPSSLYGVGFLVSKESPPSAWSNSVKSSAWVRLSVERTIDPKGKENPSVVSPLCPIRHPSDNNPTVIRQTPTTDPNGVGNEPTKTKNPSLERMGLGLMEMETVRPPTVSGSFRSRTRWSSEPWMDYRWSD